MNNNHDLEVVLILSPYFILGLSIALQIWREKRHEYWIRKVNTYEHFYRYGNQVIDLFSLFDDKYQDWAKFWDFYFKVNEAYYDASFYDKKHPRRLQRMKEISTDIWNIGRQKSTRETQLLPKARREIGEIYNEFKKEEKL